jgi:hypothetical protein
MRMHPITFWKMAALAAAVSLSFAACPPAAQAEAAGVVNDFSQDVYNELHSNSEFVKEAKQFISDARAFHEAHPDETYDNFASNHITDYPLLNTDDNSMSVMALTEALRQGNTDQDVLTRSVMEHVINQFNGRDDSNELVSSLNDSITSGGISVANGRVIGGSSHILGDQTVYGSLSVKNGIDANGQKITGVGDGEVAPGSQDAVNGSQLYTVNHRIDRMNNKINRVGAGAAALAALNPLPYNPNQKWSMAAGYGHYHDANASAFGAYYYPNEDVMVSLGSVVGNGENMVNAGVSLRLGPSGSKPMANSSVSADVEALRSLVLAQGNQLQEQGKKIEALEKQNAELLARLEQK